MDSMQDKDSSDVIKGRGSVINPVGRFEPIDVANDDPLLYGSDWEEAEWLGDRPKTQLLQDTSKTILTQNDSPDVGFRLSLNPYRGCEHGCAYCYARPTHEYLGMSCGLDFETKIMVKTNAPTLLRKKLSSRSWTPQPIAMSGITDLYQPIERRLELTRRCLEVLAEFRNPVGIVTKNQLILRDMDVLLELARHQAVNVFISVTTLDTELAGKMEPRTSRPQKRLAAIAKLTEAGVPVGVLMGPIIPGLTDHEIPKLLQHAAEAGALTAAYTILRLPYGVKDIFDQWLSTHFPDKKRKVLSHVKDLRGGQLNNSDFGKRMVGEGHYATTIAQMFQLYKKRYGLNQGMPTLSTASFLNGPEQLRLF